MGLEFNKFSPLLGSWAQKIEPFFLSGGMNTIYDFLKTEARRGKVICPENINTYRAFSETPYNQLKVVFLLQDPYPWIKNDIYVADGIAMSCANNNTPQPSLKLFYDGIEDNLYNGMNLNMNRETDLKYLCNQGVMMLNTSLTVELNKPSSHGEIWKPFTQYLMEEVFSKCDKGLIFVLCGKSSQYFGRFLNPLQHYILEVEHPAAAAHKFRAWNHGNVFKTINRILKENNNFEINWTNEPIVNQVMKADIANHLNTASPCRLPDIEIEHPWNRDIDDLPF